MVYLQRARLAAMSTSIYSPPWTMSVRVARHRRAPYLCVWHLRRTFCCLTFFTRRHIGLTANRKASIIEWVGFRGRIPSRGR
jgi:hypothetical protein